MEYHPQTYWSEVAQRIDKRANRNIMAGDDSPFYRYKRKKFLKLFHQLDFTGRKVMELGSGPGGNLQEVWKHHPEELTGLDISAEMIALAKKNGLPEGIRLIHIDGLEIPLESQSQDLVYSVTVLQHNTNDTMMESILKEMCRLSKEQVVLFERIEKRRKGDALCVGRTIQDYEKVCKECGFELKATNFINIQASYIISGMMRKVFNRSRRQEGERLSGLSRFLQKISLPFTSKLDRVFPTERDLAKMIFVRKSS